MKYTVDRKMWYRGHKPMGSLLRRDDGMMCCLGFVGKQCGLTDEDITNLESPADVYSDVKNQWPSWIIALGQINSADCSKAMDINDSENITDVLREKQLKEIFSAHGDEIEFVN